MTEYAAAHQLALEEEEPSDRNLGDWTAQADLEWNCLPAQWEAFNFIHDVDVSSPLRILAALGGWGSGKSRSCAQAFIAGCTRNSYSSAYGQTNPRSAVLAPTYRVLKQSTLVQIDSVLPREFVMRRRGLPHNDILLANGHLIELHSGAGELEGASYCNVWIDEIHHPNFDARKYLNYQARARDPLAHSLAVMVSGLPETGWVRDMFDVPSSSTRKTIMCATQDNSHIRPEVIQEFLASCPSGAEQRLLGGEWMPPVGAVYPQFDSKVHIIERECRKVEPVHLSFDVGNFAAVIIAQDIGVTLKNVIGRTEQGKGLLVCGQMLPDGMSVDQICYQIRTRTDYVVQPGVSTICVDPTTDRDELAAIRRHFPNVRVVRKERGDATYPVETGIRFMQRALRDALGNVRIFFSKSLVGTPRGILDAMSRYRYREDSDIVVKDNTRDHVLDACRYLVAEQLPAERPRVNIVKL